MTPLSTVRLVGGTITAFACDAKYANQTTDSFTKNVWNAKLDGKINAVKTCLQDISICSEKMKHVKDGWNGLR